MFTPTFAVRRIAFPLALVTFCPQLPAIAEEQAEELLAPELVAPAETTTGAEPAVVPEPAAQGPGGGIQIGGLADVLRLLREESVQQELELQPGQESKLEGLDSPLSGLLGSGLFDRLSELGPEQAEAAGAEAGDEGVSFDIKQVQDVISALLQEEQIKRLKEIMLQLRMRRKGAPSTLSTNELARALDLTREQQDELRMRGEQAAERTREQMRAKMSDLRATVQDVLTPEQNDKLDTLLGTEFDLPAAMLEPAQPAGLFGRERGEGGRLLQRRRGGLLRRRAEDTPAEPAPPQE